MRIRLLCFHVITVMLITGIYAAALVVKNNGAIRVEFDGDEVSDIQPDESNGILMASAKGICDEMGATFYYDKIENNIRIVSSDTTVETLLNENRVDVNHGKMIEMPAACYQDGKEVMFPVEFLVKVLGGEARYDSSSKTLDIRYFSKLKGNLKIGGVNTFLNVIQRSLDTLKNMNPDIDVTLVGGGSSSAVSGCIDGSYDIAIISRNLTADEAQYNKELKTYKTAKEGIAVIVNPSNNLQNITHLDAYNMFSGKEKSWNKIKGFESNGHQKPIFVNIHEAGSGTLGMFFDVGIRAFDERGDFADTAMPNASNGLVRQAVAMEPLALGIVGFSYIDNSVKALKINGHEPDEESVKSKNWPYINDINVISRNEAKGIVAKYINFMHSVKGRRIIKEEGLINIDDYYADERLK